MPNDAGRAGTPAGVFGAELRFYRTRTGLSQKDLAARANVSHDVISKIETGERPPAEDFPPRLDVVPELGTSGALTRLWLRWWRTNSLRWASIVSTSPHSTAAHPDGPASAASCSRTGRDALLTR